MVHDAVIDFGKGFPSFNMLMIFIFPTKQTFFMNLTSKFAIMFYLVQLRFDKSAVVKMWFH